MKVKLASGYQTVISSQAYLGLISGIFTITSGTSQGYIMPCSALSQSYFGHMKHVLEISQKFLKYFSRISQILIRHTCIFWVSFMYISGISQGNINQFIEISLTFFRHKLIKGRYLDNSATPCD